jgi:chemotaxis signal transduction protein
MTIELDAGKVYIPQSDVITFEDTNQLVSQGLDDLTIASVEFNGQLIPVFCLSDDFDLLDYIPDKRKVCVIIGYQNRAIGLLCNNIHLLEYSDIKVEAVPGCMTGENTPLSTLFLFRHEMMEARMGLMIRAQSLIEFVDKTRRQYA